MWLSRLNFWLPLRSWSHGLRVWAPCGALCRQLRALHLLLILCLQLSLPLPHWHAVSVFQKKINKLKNILKSMVYNRRGRAGQYKNDTFFLKQIIQIRIKLSANISKLPASVITVKRQRSQRVIVKDGNVRWWDLGILFEDLVMENERKMRITHEQVCDTWGGQSSPYQHWMWWTDQWKESAWEILEN